MAWWLGFETCYRNPLIVCQNPQTTHKEGNSPTIILGQEPMFEGTFRVQVWCLYTSCFVQLGPTRLLKKRLKELSGFLCPLSFSPGNQSFSPQRRSYQLHPARRQRCPKRSNLSFRFSPKTSFQKVQATFELYLSCSKRIGLLTFWLSNFGFPYLVMAPKG